MKKIMAVCLLLALLLSACAVSFAGAVGVISEKSQIGKEYLFSHLTLQVNADKEFNRFTIRYSADRPLLGRITYQVNRKNYTEEFFLEQGEHITFSSLIDGYVDGKIAKDVKSIELVPCEKAAKSAYFVLEGFKTDKADALPDPFFLENARFKVGILLKWGGTISYIEDKKCPDPKLGNMINHFDTGRLIQQSYYGVSADKYHKASFNNTNWSYNPVQGGDQHGHASKIVDFRYDKKNATVYIKCRPMDWAQENMPCPAYMENLYRLTDDALLVQNRFVNYFEEDHPSKHQELPAFYTVSNLGVFHYYNGKKPWTGDEYITLKDQPFWANNGKAYHTIEKGNTETWAAWTNDDGYGIGLYVPGAEIMLAGRFEFNGSKDPKNNATNYVAPLRTMKIENFKPYEYSYVISAGTVDQMRKVFEKYADVKKK